MNAWRSMKLGEVLKIDLDRVPVDAGTSYPMVGVFSFGRGLFDREPIENGKTSYRVFYRLKAEHFVMSQLFGWEGALALSSERFAGKFVSPQFPTFLCDGSQLDRRFLGWFVQRLSLWEELKSRGTGMGDRRRTLNPENLFSCTIPLPPLSEQRRIVARIEELAAEIQEARLLRTGISTEQEALLFSAYRRLTKKAPRRPLIDMAPLRRRPVCVDRSVNYPQVSVRSFGRGTFHKPSLVGSEVTWEKPFAVEKGDILISNIKAWEGAIAVASEADGGRVASHRYLTCVPIPGIATARFVCFYLLTAEGLFHVGEASPGSADRNRTTSAKALMKIPIPAPSYEQQLWFDNLYNHVESARRLQKDAAAELDALLPSILDKAFKGEL